MNNSDTAIVNRRRAFLQQLGVPLSTMPRLSTSSLVSSQSISNSLPEIPSTAIIAFNRMGFGPRPGDIDAFNSLGATDIIRLETYIEQQLNPMEIDDTACDNRLAALDTTTLDKSLSQLWSDHMIGDMSGEWLFRMRPYWDVERATFIRAMYSERQLHEVMADFWHNHFNVQGGTWDIAPVMVHYDRDVIRAHMWGNFREMLEAVAKSPAMLMYLDNENNTRAGPNENYARELFELHGLGAENYLGSIPKPEWIDPITRFPVVPADVDGYPIGYIDYDVYEATRCFTGWTIDPDTGAFMFVEENHDRFNKILLRTYFPPDQMAETDGQLVLDLIAFHPGTARHICRKLCQRLVSDKPPASLVASAAELFAAQKGAPDQIQQVIRHILISEPFRKTWGGKVKRPFEAIISAARALQFDISLRQDDGDSNSFVWLYSHTGQPLFQWPAPNGYPDVKEAWHSTTPVIMSWRLMNWMVDASVADAGEVFYADIIGQTPTQTRDATSLVDFWVLRILHRPVDASTRQKLIVFMAQEYGAEEVLPFDDPEWQGNRVRQRLRSLVGLILLLPDFGWR